MTSTDPILAKIRKLLAKAEDQAATAEESELYTAKATQLIADYGIDQALLALDDPDQDRIGDRVVSLDAPYAADKAELLCEVAQALRCRAVLVTRRVPGGKELSVHLFGHESDLVRSDLLFTSLLLQAATGLARTPVPPREHKAAFRRSWLAGFRMAITRRLAAAEQQAETAAEQRSRAAGGASASLVLADRGERVLDAMHREYPSLRTARPRTLSGSGLPQGWAEGHRADLGGSRLDTTSARHLER
ncbi:DUF2786 domain-containing protein [Nocardioides sp.]|uniref:DUF2786 domain-containing protein n=1 Tax=Nocardioides sp. TaxID=35761 RepID=UPI002732BEA7|nr:DUF2786 domain-containing protein [Nocardioides sp.]MDP3893259.1 DUF2786 domain-containing protein [Nocardioides sp.]